MRISTLPSFNNRMESILKWHEKSKRQKKDAPAHMNSWTSNQKQWKRYRAKYSTVHRAFNRILSYMKVFCGIFCHIYLSFSISEQILFSPLILMLLFSLFWPFLSCWSSFSFKKFLLRDSYILLTHLLHSKCMRQSSSLRFSLIPQKEQKHT